MAWSSTSRHAGDEGFATPAAVVVSLGVALVATAVTGSAIAELKLARADYDRSQVESRLDGAQAIAILAVISGGASTRMRWTIASGDGTVDVLAEPEAAKLSLNAAADLDSATLSRLAVSDTGDLKARLKQLTASRTADQDLASLDASPIWRACARSLIAVHGAATKPPVLKARAPVQNQVAWRIGEVWRIRVTGGELGARSSDRWTDERIVRFTGDAEHPAAIVDRRFGRSGKEGDPCDAIFAS